MKPNEVLIDGVRYVPATEAAANMDAVTRGLLAVFYGDTHKLLPEDVLSEIEGLTVRVMDDGVGESFQDVLATIADYVSPSGVHK